MCSALLLPTRSAGEEICNMFRICFSKAPHLHIHTHTHILGLMPASKVRCHSETKAEAGTVIHEK